MSTVPIDVIEALSRLNVHARAWGFGKRAIYAYKTLVAGVLAEAGELWSVDLAEWKGQCRDCGGTGRYYYIEGGRSDHCWKCSSTGTASLKFVVTVLPNGHTWHHPYDHAGNAGRTVAEIAGVLVWASDKGRYVYRHNGVEYPEAVWFSVGTWAPGQAAEKLPAENAAACLNTVESWALQRHATGACRWLSSTADREMRAYHLELGRVADSCWYCGSPHVYCGLSRTGPPFDWSAPVCQKHSKLPIEAWPARDACPHSAITAAIHEWRERHQRIGFLQEEHSYS